MSTRDHKIHCDKHGEQQATFVCQHVVQTLVDGRPRGFWTSDNPDNPRPDAWCDDCEVRVQRDGEWNDENEALAGVTLLCGACYDQARALNGK